MSSFFHFLNAIVYNKNNKELRKGIKMSVTKIDELTQNHQYFKYKKNHRFHTKYHFNDGEWGGSINVSNEDDKSLSFLWSADKNNANSTLVLKETPKWFRTLHFNIKISYYKAQRLRFLSYTQIKKESLIESIALAYIHYYNIERDYLNCLGTTFSFNNRSPKIEAFNRDLSSFLTNFHYKFDIEHGHFYDTYRFVEKGRAAS